MAKKSININHSTSSILSSDGAYIKLGDNTAVKVGSGTSISNGIIDNSTNTQVLAEYAGAIRINNTTNKLEYCDGTTWIEFTTKLDGEDIPMVYSFLF